MTERFLTTIWRAMIAAAGVRTWAIIGAAMALTGFAAWHSWIVWRGPWPAEEAAHRLSILAWGLWGALGIIGMIVLALTGLGVVASVSRSGLNLNVGDED